MSEPPPYQRLDHELSSALLKACVWEATARKAGNVHPGASFSDLAYSDFVHAAELTAPIMARAARWGIGETVYRAAMLVSEVFHKNVNLGICLLLTPLAAGANSANIWDGARQAVSRATIDDSRLVYQAIRILSPGGMGRVQEQDLRTNPTLPLRDIMELAAERDAVAREYASGFHRLEHEYVPFFLEMARQTEESELPILLTHLRLIADGDTLIRRKGGPAICQEAASQAAILLRHWQEQQHWDDFAYYEFDQWLRADGNRRNPGTSADFIAAILFVVFSQGWWHPPSDLLSKITIPIDSYDSD